MGNDIRAALASRVLVADGAMGTMVQAADVPASDFGGYDGCNEILNVTRPDVVQAIHRAYLDAGADCVETNTFGANATALAEYGIADRIGELARAGARLARVAADEAAADGRPRFVLGSMGPGTKLPSLGHVTYATLRDAYQTQAAALLAGGVDAFQIETSQDLLQVKAAVVGARRACRAVGVRVPIFASITMETTGTMLLGSEIGAVITALGALRVDGIGLNCGTGPDRMGEHLRELARRVPVLLTCMPNAGMPELTPDGPRYPMGPDDFAAAVASFADEHGVGLVGGCCGTTPAHIARLAELVRGRAPLARHPEVEPALASLFGEVALRQETSYLSIGERTNANGSKLFREAMLEGRWDDCVDIAKQQSRDGAHVLDVCVDYTGRDGTLDMRELASRLATAVTTPLMLDSTEPAVIEAGLECLAGRPIINSVNYEDGARLARLLPIVVEHGAAVVALTIDADGQARTAVRKVAVAERLIADLTTRWGFALDDIVVDCLTFPITTGQDETRRDALETIEAIRELAQRHPGLHFTLGVSNVSFGLQPAARAVLNSVFLAECQAAGLDSAIVHAARIIPIARIPDEQRQAALDLIYDRRRTGYDPLKEFLGMFTQANSPLERAELVELPVAERLRRRIVDGAAHGLEADLTEALAGKSALDIVNDDLLVGMKTVGELFGAGQMQLPFVLASAEVMKKAVAFLEPHLEAGAASGRGTVVLATVAGDVHDIGKNLVDIILTNNGYRVVNLGIKQPVGAIADAAVANGADAIGMSGLLVKSTTVMRDNLIELNRRGLAHVPVLLGGAALTRAYVEGELSAVYDGVVRYARDAFEGLALLEQITNGTVVAPPARARARARVAPPAVGGPRSDVARDVDVPVPPFWGSQVIADVPLDEVAALLDERALFAGRWGLRAGVAGPSYEELVASDGRPRLHALLDRIRDRGLAGLAVAYGYWPCHSAGEALVVGDPEDPAREVARFTFPRQPSGRRLCLPDYFRDETQAAELGPDVLPLQVVTVGPALSQATAELFRADKYREYLELHGVGVQLAEALAEWSHARVRAELGFTDEGPHRYRGERYSFGYPACPDLAQRGSVVALLEADRIGVTLSNELQLHPEQSTDALIVHHPEAVYFNAR